MANSHLFHRSIGIFVLLLLSTCLLLSPCFSARAVHSAKRTARAQSDNSRLVTQWEPIIRNASATLEAGNHEQIIKLSESILEKASDSGIRTRAYWLLITAQRTGHGYDAAIKAAENANTKAKKAHRAAAELKQLSALINDLKHRRASYMAEIAEQQKMIKAHPGTEMAATAAFRIALAKQSLGTRSDAISAYTAVAKDYALTRPGWKAAQELAWLKQGSAKSSVDGKASLDTLIHDISVKSGKEAALRRAWDMASGKDYNPTYADVLRLEAITAELRDKEPNVAQKAAERVDPIREQSTNPEAAVIGQDTNRFSKTGSKKAPRGPSFLANAASGPFPSAIDGAGIMMTPRARPVMPTPSGRPTSIGSQPEIIKGPELPLAPKPAPAPAPVPIPKPVLPNPVIVPKPAPDPPFTQWTCSKEYRNAGDDLTKVEQLIKTHINKAATMLDSKDAVKRQTALGVMLGAATCASETLNKMPLAVQIIDTYVVPNLNTASDEKHKYLSKYLIQDKAVAIWTKSKDYDKATEALKNMLQAEQNRTQADALRIRLAVVLERQEKYEEAISYLKDIDDLGDLNGAREYIAELEKKLRGKGQK